MKPSDKTFEIIDLMYQGLPFVDESGEKIYVPDPLDRLINAFELVEHLLYRVPSAVSSQKYGKFLLKSKDLLLSISLDLFRSRADTLDCNAKEILLRNIENINRQDLEDNSLTDYAKFLL